MWPGLSPLLQLPLLTQREIARAAKKRLVSYHGVVMVL
jgi:hypothetical protein